METNLQQDDTRSPAPPNHPLAPGEPYCASCGYALTGLTDSPRCPECGKPLVEVLTRTSAPLVRGRRYTSSATIFGWPVIQIASGPYPQKGELRGTARALIAIGDRAYGGIAIGGLAIGGVAIGGASFGVCALGGFACGALTALGGGAVGGFAAGGGAAGVIASGGGAAGVIASGGGAIGWYASGGGAWGRYVMDSRRSDPEAVALFTSLSPVLGPPMTGSLLPMAYAAAVPALLALFITGAAVWLISRTGRPRSTQEPA
jgi:hypothetical protein